VTLQDGDGKSGEAKRVTLQIADHWRVNQIKEEYAKQMPESAVLEGDKLLYRGKELDDGKRVYQYSIMAHAGMKEMPVLVIQREDTTQVVTKYMCADCGSEVRLKQKDAVRCRECGYRIVYKKRTTKSACQYLAR